MASTKLDPAMLDAAVTADHLMENLWIAGDPAECADKMHQLPEEGGGRVPPLDHDRHRHPARDHENLASS